MKGRDEFLGIQDTLKALADPIRREILNPPETRRLRLLYIFLLCYAL